ncbi:MAG: FKBP-type peptidyl-prolyl cis-trans isomerase [Saprospiraceae bacterium]
MHIYRLLGLMLLVGSITGCGSSSSEETPPPAPPSLPAVEEDDLLLRLSALYDPDTTLHARDNNALLDYAISNLLDVRPTATGLYYQILKPGTGDSIRWGDHLSAHYKGVLPDGTVFADSRPRKTPLVFYVGNMIDG